jgi:hypothetical protein
MPGSVCHTHPVSVVLSPEMCYNSISVKTKVLFGILSVCYVLRYHYMFRPITAHLQVGIHIYDVTCFLLILHYVLFINCIVDPLLRFCILFVMCLFTCIGGWFLIKIDKLLLKFRTEMCIFYPVLKVIFQILLCTS